MTTTERMPPSGPAALGVPTEPPDEPKREPMWRIVIGSLAAGLLGALVLTLGVFPGAPEHVVSGCVLLAFALGWTMLAVLSTRLPSQPQRWALVPAVFMAVVGIALLVFTPGDRVLNAAGWVWPPVVLALAVWMFIQLRRALGGRVRWLLYAGVAALAISSVGGVYETAAVAQDHHRYAAPGTLYDVGGHRLHLNCVGSGRPTVVLENGLAETSPFWSRVAPEVGRTTRVCSYDRAGQGWSDDVAAPQDGLAVAADLHALLGRAHEAGPYVLVGHSAGGSYAMVYAARYPDEVAGMVLLDSTSPDQFTVLPDFATQYSMTRRMVAMLPSLGRLGAARVFPASADADLPEPAASQARAFATTARQLRNVRDEQSTYHDLFAQAGALATLDGKPLVVVTTSESQHGTKGWTTAQDSLARLSTNSQHRTVKSTHEGLLTDAHSFEPSVQAIADVVQSIRAGVPVATR